MSQESHLADKQELYKQPILHPAPKKRERVSFLNWTKVAEVFPELDNRTLCHLTEMDDIRPTTVLDLVPGSSRAQIGAFLQIAEEKKKQSPRRDSSKNQELKVTSSEWLCSQSSV